MSPQLEEFLVILFQEVADAVDGGERVPRGIKQAYLDGMQIPDVREFYGHLVDTNPSLELIK